jgi:hypothetical protein
MMGLWRLKTATHEGIHKSPGSHYLRIPTIHRRTAKSITIMVPSATVGGAFNLSSVDIHLGDQGVNIC